MSLIGKLAGIEARFAQEEPRVQAFLPEEARFARLRQDAQELFQEFPDAAMRPPLFGVLLGIKDIIRVTGFATRAGSQLPAKLFDGPEASCVARLKRAGALVAGKTRTTEFAYFEPGPTRNPRRPEHTPGGSSSGSAAAVAAGLCELALGTQTVGSVIRPAAFCGVLAFKPTFGRVPLDGVIPLAPSFDTLGWFAGELGWLVRTAAVLMEDWSAPQGPALKPVLGVPEGPYLAKAAPEGLAHFRETLRRLEAAGFTVRSVAALEDFEALAQRHTTVLAGEAYRVHRAWFERHADLYRPRTRALLEQGRAVGDAELERARAGRDALRGDLEALRAQLGIDLWLAPSAPGTAPRGLESTGDPAMNLPWTHAGLPALNLPSGRDAQGLPFGLQVVGGWRCDEALLAWAPALAQALGPATLTEPRA